MNNTLRQIYFIITRACNYNCPFCIRENLSGKNSMMQKQQALDVLSKLACRYPEANLVITGGEPFVHQDWESILMYAVEHFRLVSVPTNGSFGKEVATRLKTYLKGNLRLQISLDGPLEVHDSIRGKGAYEKVMNNLRDLCDVSGHVSLSSTVRSDTLAHMLSLAKELNSRSFSYWKVDMEQVYNPLRQPVIDVARWNNFVDELIPLCNYDIKIKKIYDFPLMDKCLSIYNPQLHRINTNCGYGQAKLYVTPNYDVLPCSCTDNIIGNLEDDSIDKIEEAMKSLVPVISEDSPCYTCKYKAICNGGCPGYSQKVFGKTGMGDIRCPKVQEYYSQTKEV